MSISQILLKHTLKMDTVLIDVKDYLLVCYDDLLKFESLNYDYLFDEDDYLFDDYFEDNYVFDEDDDDRLDRWFN